MEPEQSLLVLRVVTTVAAGWSMVVELNEMSLASYVCFFCFFLQAPPARSVMSTEFCTFQSFLTWIPVYLTVI